MATAISRACAILAILLGLLAPIAPFTFVRIAQHHGGDGHGAEKMLAAFLISLALSLVMSITELLVPGWRHVALNVIAAAISGLTLGCAAVMPLRLWGACP